MYKTTEVYEIGMRNAVEVNIAAIEKMVDTQNAENTITVIHMFGESHIVIKDITGYYRLPKNILLYQVRDIKNFDELKNYGRWEPASNIHLFMYNKNNGMWDNRWPDYDRASLMQLRLARAERRTEAQLVHDMQKEVRNLPIDIHKTYIRKVEGDYQPASAKMYLWGPIPGDDFKIGENYFDEKFKLAKTRVINERCVVPVR